MDCSVPDFPVLPCVLELAQTHLHWISDAIQPSHPLLPTYPPALSLSQHQGLFQWVCSSHHVAKVLELQHQPFQWIPLGLTDLISCCPRVSEESSPAQVKSINSLVLSFLYGPSLTSIHDHWKNHTWTIQMFVGKVMSLLFDMLPRFVTAFLPRSKCFLISWLQSPPTVILEPKKIKCPCFHFSSSIWHEVIGPDTMMLIFWKLFHASFFTLLFHPNQKAL